MEIRHCVKCGRPVTVHCTPEQFAAWQRGSNISVAMKDVPKEEREMLLSGICGICWDILFKEEGDDE